MLRRLSLPLLAFAILAVPASAEARVNVAVGVGDQSARMFADPNYRALALKKTRYFIHWDAMAASKKGELDKADAFVKAANAAGVKVLMHISTNNLTAKQAKLPSVAAYEIAAAALIAHFRPMGVTEWGVWNEVNHNTQPTYKSPKRAAEFYKAFRALPCSGCRIVALDVLDQKGVEDYIAKWFAAAGTAGKRAKIIGIHNYSQVNRRITEKKSSDRYPGTKRIIDAVRKNKRNTVSKFWYTETGGVVNFGGSLPCNKDRAASRTKFMFDLTTKYDKQIERLYSYNWYGAGCNGFDAGLVEASGKVRPAYAVFKSQLKNFRR